jgi:hypothetical protein
MHRSKSKQYDQGASLMLLTVFLAFLLSACDENPTPKTQDKSLMDEDNALLADMGRAAPELEQRLMKSVTVQDGLLLVRDPLMGQFESYVLPANSPWIISCGIGLSVTFGTAVSGDGSSVGNEVEIHLARPMIKQEACAVLAPSLGKRLLAMVRESSASR